MVARFNPKQVMINLTPAAAAHFTEQQQAHPKAIGLRLFTKKAGCSGLTYQSALIESIDTDDIQAAGNSPLPIYIDKKSLTYLNGLTIDFIKKELGQSQLIFINPNETGRCGCGESFTIDEQFKDDV